MIGAADRGTQKEAGTQTERAAEAFPSGERQRNRNAGVVVLSSGGCGTATSGKFIVAFCFELAKIEINCYSD